MSQTVQKQQSSNTDSEDQKLELENNLDKSWSGLYSRWKKQLERDFEDDPSQKWKLWLHGSIAGSFPIIFLALQFPFNTLFAISGFLWLSLMKRQELSRMVVKTVTLSLYGSGLLLITVPFLIATTGLLVISKIKELPKKLQNTF